MNEFTNIYLKVHIISMVYCFWRSLKRNREEINVGATNVNPALESLGILFIAPFLAVGDIIITWVKFLKRYYSTPEN